MKPAIIIPAVFVALAASLVLAGSWGRGGGLVACPKGFIGGGLTPCVPNVTDAAAGFEFAPASGAGMVSICDEDGNDNNPTGSMGEALTFSRAGFATCIMGTSLSGGFSDDSVRLVPPNVARVMYGDTSGIAGVLLEGATTNNTVRSTEFDNIVWVSTATVTADVSFDPMGFDNGDELNDTSAGAIQGSCQTIVNTSATKHVVSFFVLGESVTSAQVTMTGVGSSTGDCSANFTGLATDTYTRVSCASPAAYGVALASVVVCINVGTVAATTGTIVVFGAQHETNKISPSSFIRTIATPVTRAADSSLQLATVPDGLAQSGSSSATFIPEWTNGQPSQKNILLYLQAAAKPLFGNAGTDMNINDGTNTVTISAPFTFGTAARYWSSWTGPVMTIASGASISTGPFDGTFGSALTTLDMGSDGTSLMNGVIKQVCIDSRTARCR